MKETAAGSVLGGRYRLQAELGSGGMGTVHRAINEATGDAVAVKVIKSGQDDPELVARFRRERVFMAIDSPHIVRILDHGDDDGVLYLVMELLHGQTLRDRLAQVDVVPVPEALAIARDIARALVVAHAAGVAHRDIKPANIMLTATSPSRAVLLDFGIARSLDPGATMTSTSLVVGTAGYIAPEISMGGRAYDARADLYSLGVVLYEMVVGAPPFVAANALALAALQASEDPQPPRVREPTVPADVDALVMRLVARNPARRPADAATVVAALDALLSGAPAAAEPEVAAAAVIDSSPYATVRWDPLGRIVRFVRSPEPFATAENVGWGYTVVRDAFPVGTRSDKCLLVDLRRGPMRAEPRFAKIVVSELPRLYAGWRKVAALVATEEGARQLADLRARSGSPGRTFFDEDTAFAWLLAEE
jgi:serine/threonine protein kinase